MDGPEMVELGPGREFDQQWPKILIPFPDPISCHTDNCLLSADPSRPCCTVKANPEETYAAFLHSGGHAGCSISCWAKKLNCALHRY